MKKVYLFIYNDDAGTREEIKAIISVMSKIST